MPVDVPVTDVPEDSSPSATDHDFVSFVRSTLSALNTKMDNLLSNQAAFESKLEAIERRVTINTTVTTELSRATEFNANTINPLVPARPKAPAGYLPSAPVSARQQ